MSLIESAKNRFLSQKGFVLYAKPFSNTLNAHFFDSISNDFLANESYFIVAPFSEKEKKILIPLEELVYETIVAKSHEKNQNAISFTHSEKETFEQMVTKAVIEISTNKFQKVVLSRKKEAHVDVAIFDSFENLLSAYPETFRYLLFVPNEGFWMGATPEKLLEIENNQLKTMALAGTQLFAENLQWHEKEKDEQQLVTHYITNKLRPFSEKITVSETQTIQAGNLAHLKTDIVAKLPINFDLEAVVRALHPTSAVCGMPFEAAQEFIEKNEVYERSFYTGYIGVWNPNEKTDLYVNLRCAKYNNNLLSIFVGCGITKYSVPEKEFVETENKAQTILDILKINK